MSDPIPPKKMARRIVRLLATQEPDYNYVKKVFAHVRQALGFPGRTRRPEPKLPDLLTEEEMTRFYEAVWHAAEPAHMVMIKLFLYTGVRSAEMSNIELSDVDLKGLKIRIGQGEGRKDRYVPIPDTFFGELTQYVAQQRKRKARYLFESRLHDKLTTRWISEIVKRYSRQAGIEKRIYPHLFRHQLLTYLTRKGIIDTKIQLLSGHETRQSLAVYQTMTLADVEAEYQDAMKEFPVK